MIECGAAWLPSHPDAVFMAECERPPGHSGWHEAERDSARITWPPEPGPECGTEALSGRMVCQLRRGHDGAHEDLRAVAKERRA